MADETAPRIARIDNVSPADTCAVECVNNNQCLAWVWWESKTLCYLYDTILTRGADGWTFEADTTSGIKDTTHSYCQSQEDTTGTELIHNNFVFLN